MTAEMTPRTRTILRYILIIAAFALISAYARGHEDYIRLLLAGGGVFGALLFVALTAAFVIFVIPLDIVLLIPLGVALWGPLPTALMSIIGWTIGATIAFHLARTYGLPLVTRMIGERNVARLHDRIPTGNLFWPVVFLRMLVPVDLLSYALGLFTEMPGRRYLLATAIGVAPFGFVFAYVGALPAWYALAVLAVIFVLVSSVLLRYSRKPERVLDDGPNRDGRE